MSRFFQFAKKLLPFFFFSLFTYPVIIYVVYSLVAEKCAADHVQAFIEYMAITQSSSD